MSEQQLDQLERAFISIARLIVGRTVETAEGRRLDKAAYFMMGTLEHLGATRLTDLAACARLDVSTVSRQVRTLEDAGFVGRTPDPADKRAALVELSPAGTAMLADLRAARRRLIESALTGWSATERSDLVDHVLKLAASLETALEIPRSDTREAVSA